MGYSYGRNAAGNWALACDNCGDVGSVRKRPCRFKVLGDSHRTMDGKRHALPYCQPPALCSPCFTRLGGTRGVHGDECRDGAAYFQARADAKEAALDAGLGLVAAAWGDWQEYVPEGMTGVLFTGRASKPEFYRLVPADSYHPGAKPALTDYPEAVPWCGPDGKASTKETAPRELVTS